MFFFTSSEFIIKENYIQRFESTPDTGKKKEQKQQVHASGRKYFKIKWKNIAKVLHIKKRKMKIMHFMLKFYVCASSCFSCDVCLCSVVVEARVVWENINFIFIAFNHPVWRSFFFLLDSTLNMELLFSTIRSHFINNIK